MVILDWGRLPRRDNFSTAVYSELWPGRQLAFTQTATIAILRARDHGRRRGTALTAAIDERVPRRALADLWFPTTCG